MQWRTRVEFACAFLVAALFLLPSVSHAKGIKYQRTLVRYTVPDVVLVNQDGKKVRFKDLADSERPVLVGFIYTTCNTICPVLSAGFSAFQRRLGPDAEDRATLISVTIDPTHDTPPVLQAYAERYLAGPGWHFLTGRQDDVLQLLRAFHTTVDDKTGHSPLTLMRAPGSDTWVRLDGLLGPSDLKTQFDQLPGAKP